jgi:hypothetical protein
MVPVHIYIKELWAAIKTIEHVLNLEAREPSANGHIEIHIGIDNSAAAFALSNMYSRNDFACSLLLNLQRRLENESAVVRIVQLRSEQNAADPASRGTTCTTDLYQRCCNAFAAARNGIRIGE